MLGSQPPNLYLFHTFHIFIKTLAFLFMWVGFFCVCSHFTYHLTRYFHVRIQRVRTSSLKNHKKYRGSKQYWSRSPEKIHKATKPVFNVGPTSARQRNVIKWRFAGEPMMARLWDIWILKNSHSWTASGKTVWIRLWIRFSYVHVFLLFGNFVKFVLNMTNSTCTRFEVVHNRSIEFADGGQLCNYTTHLFTTACVTHAD